MNYKFYVTEDKRVICVSSYAGKTVKGIAKCNPEDTFDLDTGKKIAKARCDYKIAKKRVVRAREKHAAATRLVGDAREYQAKMQSYYNDAFGEFMKAHEELDNLKQNM